MITTLVADPDRDRRHAGAPNTRPFQLRRPPTLEPPFDDEHTTPAVPNHAQLPIEWTPPVTTPVPVPRRSAGSGHTTLGDDGSARTALGDDGSARTALGDDGSARTALSPSESSPTYACARYIRLCLEVLNGFRPATHLRVLGGPVEFTNVVRQLSRRRNGCGHFPPRPAVPASNPSRPPLTRRPASRAVPDRYAVPPVVATPAAPPAVRRSPNVPATQPFRLVRLRVSEPLDGVAEVVAVLSHAGTSLAVALRLERHSSGWTCTVMQVI